VLIYQLPTMNGLLLIRVCNRCMLKYVNHALIVRVNRFVLDVVWA